MSDAFDVIVVGGGPGGYVCAIRCAQLGLKTAVVERDRMGGICLNWGCIPTKALLRSSEIWHLMHRLDEYGFSADNFKFDIEKIVKRSRAVSKQLSDGVSFLMKKHKIVVIPGEAKLTGKGKLSVTKDGKSADYTAKNIVLATGEQDICKDENIRLSGILNAKAIPHRLDVWGNNTGHDWHWWQQMAVKFFL